jgi:hypothetical protein
LYEVSKPSSTSISHTRPSCVANSNGAGFCITFTEVFASITILSSYLFHPWISKYLFKIASNFFSAISSVDSFDDSFCSGLLDHSVVTFSVFSFVS